MKRKTTKSKKQEKFLDSLSESFWFGFETSFARYGADRSKKKRPKKRHERLLSSRYMEPELDRKAKLLIDASVGEWRF